jgi:hypothetical protein
MMTNAWFFDVYNLAQLQILTQLQLSNMQKVLVFNCIEVMVSVSYSQFYCFGGICGVVNALLWMDYLQHY